MVNVVLSLQHQSKLYLLSHATFEVKNYQTVLIKDASTFFCIIIIIIIVIALTGNLHFFGGTSGFQKIFAV